MKHYTITCTEHITLPPDHAYRVLHPHATEKVYPVYTVNGERYIEIKADTLGGILLTKLADLHVSGGELNAVPAPIRVDGRDMPRIYPQDIPALTDITDTVPTPRSLDVFNQSEYVKDYQRRNIRYRKMNFNLTKPEDTEMLEWIDRQPEGASNYLKKLVTADMNRP